MTLDEILLGFRMIAMGRPNQEYAQKLAEALAVVLATPEERLADIAAEIAIPVGEVLESPQTASAPSLDKPRRGRPPKPKVSDGENVGRRTAEVPELGS